MSVEHKIKIGRKAPAFSLKNQDDEKCALKDFAGKWLVLYFYPKDNTPGCTTEACDFTRALQCGGEPRSGPALALPHG